MKMSKTENCLSKQKLSHIHVFILSTNKIIYQASMYSRPHYSLGNHEDKYDTRPSTFIVWVQADALSSEPPGKGLK